MKYNCTRTFAALLVAALAMTGAATATEEMIEIDMKPVGDINNTPDTSTGYGRVTYEYQIGTYEVTNKQYAAFLNTVAKTDTHGLYNENMGSELLGGITRSGVDNNYVYTVKSDMASKPVNYVSFWDAARFVNWLTNGQGGAETTEYGVYNLTTLGITNNSILRDFTGLDGLVYLLPSMDEWYKAAYYNASTGGYQTYPMTDTPKQNDTASFRTGEDSNRTNGNLMDVNAYNAVSGASSPYGTHQQGGNLFEWADTIPVGEISGTAETGDPAHTDTRSVLGGSYNYDIGALASSGQRYANVPADEYAFIGFRVAALYVTAVPEPGMVAGAAGLAALVFGVWGRRGRRIL
jgi:formylglycine-generating enzyme required for sulfatase activity